MKDIFLTPTYQALINLAELCVGSHDTAVLENCWYLAEKEGGDLDLIIAALLFRGLQREYVRNILESLEYDNEKIAAVDYLIDHQNFSKNSLHPTLELEILHDAYLMQELMTA